MLTCSQRLGPVDAPTVPYSVNVPAGKKIRFNVRDSVNPGFEGSAFTDALDIGEFIVPIERGLMTQALGPTTHALLLGPSELEVFHRTSTTLRTLADRQDAKRYRSSERIR